MPAFSLQNMLAERGFRPQAHINSIPNIYKLQPFYNILELRHIFLHLIVTVSVTQKLMLSDHISPDPHDIIIANEY